ncbi:hypothetical protein ACJIZ3_012520 [Penstemon smallii]|uniref:Replication factor A C-terminal domain-containing protein n=1 Tax=Penstemon smallii TaxID=265156 RepID=A0ABD3URI9_9LAMI
MVYGEVFFDMTTRTMHIKEIKKETKSWAVRVMVEAKTQPRLPARGVKRYQRLLLVDETGQKISATMFDPDIDHFKDMFSLYKTYTVSNAFVSKIEEKYDKFGHPYQWIINSKTACNPDPETGISRSLIKSEYASIGNLANLVRQNIFIDVVAIVIQKGELRSFTLYNKDTKLREFAIMNQEKKVVMLTLWNAIAEAEGDFIDKATDTLPIIRATQLLVSAHRDGTLSSTASTVIELEPEIPEVASLKIWRSNNLKCIVDAINAKDYFERVESSAVFPTNEITLISDILSEEKNDRFTVEVAAVVINTEQKYYYMACKKCFSSVDADYDYEYTCAMCGDKTQAKPRERIHLSIFDSTGSLDVTVFGPPVTHLMEMDSEMCMKLSDKGEAVTAEWINHKLSGKTFYMKIRRKENSVGAHLKQQYTVINLRLKEMPAHSQDRELESVPKETESVLQKRSKHIVGKTLFPGDASVSKEKPSSDVYDSSV